MWCWKSVENIWKHTDIIVNQSTVLSRCDSSTMTLAEVNLIFLVLCIALRKCSTSGSAGSSKGWVGWAGAGPIPDSSPSLHIPLTHFLTLPGAVKLHWTVKAHERCSVVSQTDQTTSHLVSLCLLLSICPFIEGVLRWDPVSACYGKSNSHPGKVHSSFYTTLTYITSHLWTWFKF